MARFGLSYFIRFCCLRVPGSGHAAAVLPVAGDIGIQKATYQAGNLVVIFLKRKVACIQQVKIHILKIALVGKCTFCREDIVVLAPDNKSLRLVLTNRGLPSRVGCIDARAIHRRHPAQDTCHP